jgi:hypothetical protein
MRFRNHLDPSEDELRNWAYDPAASEPAQDWDLILSWRLDRGLLGRCVECAADPGCPKAGFFLRVLYEWVDAVARDDNFDFRRSMYDGWLDAVKGIRDDRVRAWRHRARLLFQGVEPFDRERWWAGFSQTIPVADPPAD